MCGEKYASLTPVLPNYLSFSSRDLWVSELPVSPHKTLHPRGSGEGSEEAGI